ncbi:unnamed protein product [Urochloa humidicola]
MAIGAAVGTAVSEEEGRKEEGGVGVDAVAFAEVFIEGHRGGGDRDRVLREAGKSDVFDREGEQEPAGPFPGAEGGAGGPQTEGDEDAENFKAEKRAPAVGALAAAAAAPDGHNLFDHALGGRKDEERKGKSARGVAADSRGLGGFVARNKQGGDDGNAPGAEPGATAGPSGVNAEHAALGGSDNMKREANSAAGVAADPYGHAEPRAAGPKSTREEDAAGVARPSGFGEERGAPAESTEAAAAGLAVAAGGNNLRVNGVGVRGAAMVAFGAALVAVGTARAQYKFAVDEQLGVPTTREGTLESMSPFLSGHHRRSVTASALPQLVPHHPLPGVEADQPPAMHQELPHLGRGPWVHMPRSSTSTAIAARTIFDDTATTPAPPPPPPMKARIGCAHSFCPF